MPGAPAVALEAPIARALHGFIQEIACSRHRGRDVIARFAEASSRGPMLRLKVMRKLPRFLICETDDEVEGVLVLHTQAPRFLMEIQPGGEGDLMLFDHAQPAEVISAKQATHDFF